MDWIYSGISNITGGRVESVVLSIVIITIIIYMCLLPLTIKQQKFSKLSQKMQPEMQAIQAKYKNKKDQASMISRNIVEHTVQCKQNRHLYKHLHTASHRRNTVLLV